MKLITIILGALLAVSFLMTSCMIASRETKVDIKCEQFAENKQIINEFHVESGDKIIVKLCSNPTTGFQWEYKMSVENVLTEQEHNFEKSDVNLTGAAGMESWTFEAGKSGTVEVLMTYSQPWDGGMKAENTYTMFVTVD